jgi:hypothetical protein
VIAIAPDDPAEVSVVEHPAVHLVRRHGEEERCEQNQVERGDTGEITQRNQAETNQPENEQNSPDEGTPGFPWRAGLDGLSHRVPKVSTVDADGESANGSDYLRG